MENNPTDSLPIGPSNAITTTTSSSDFEKRPESCRESAKSLIVNDGSTTSPQASPFSPSSSPSVTSPTPTSVVSAPIQLVGKSSRKLKSSKKTDKQQSKEKDDAIYIDTTELCKRIAYELSQHSIPQSIFAERILNRSQGTLSGLLRDPKPWNMLKSTGRQTFLRMFNWLKHPLPTRLRILDAHDTEPDEMEKDTADTTNLDAATATAAVSVEGALSARKRSSATGGCLSATRRPRSNFTPIQKRTLEEILMHTSRPSREMNIQIAHHLKLDLSTVANYFMNARRRRRVSDEDVAASPAQLDAVMNDHASYCKPQAGAMVGSDN